MNKFIEQSKLSISSLEIAQSVCLTYKKKNKYKSTYKHGAMISETARRDNFIKRQTTTPHNKFSAIQCQISTCYTHVLPINVMEKSYFTGNLPSFTATAKVKLYCNLLSTSLQLLSIICRQF